MAVELVMQVPRGEDDRLTGRVRLAPGTDARHVSGRIELRPDREKAPTPGSVDVLGGLRLRGLGER